MIRRRSLLAQVVLFGLLGVLAFPSASSAVRPIYFISLTPSGPSPAALSSPAGLGHFVITNTDTVAHTIVFANGSCSEQVAAGAQANCDLGFLGYVGDYAYTVDDTSEGDITIELVGRSVSLLARSHFIRRGSLLTLHGRLREDNASWSPPSAGVPQRIIVVARPYPGHPHHRAAVVMATVSPRTKSAPFGELLWHADIHPRWSMTYVAIASYQPPGGRVWERALSEPFRVNVRR